MKRAPQPLAATLMLILSAALAAANAAPPLAEQPLPLAMEKPASYLPHVMSGGPGKDGIPAIDRPQFIDAGTADERLEPDDVVFGLVQNGQARAYPQRILVWHEIVNDTVGEDPLSITYCPLTGTAMGFLRGDTTLGVSGKLLNNNVVMYDRATDTEWSQILGTAIDGELAGEALREVRLIWTTWERWKDRYPDTQVLSTRTGHARDYNRDPYGDYTPPSGYYVSEHLLFPVIHRGRQLPTKEIVIGVRTSSGALSFRKSSVRDAGVMTGSAGEEAYLAVYDSGLDAVHVFHNPQGITPEHNQLSFGADGVRLNGEPLPLQPAIAIDAFYFAWSAFYPTAPLYE